MKDQGVSRRSFPKATFPGDFLVPFASLQKELAAAAAKPLSCFKGMFRLRAGYFPEKESSQSSPGLRARTQESVSAALAIAAGAEPS